MCGIVGLVGRTAISQDLCDALTALQHRGQDAAGMATSFQDHLHLHKGRGLVRDVFRTRHMIRLQGQMGLGHVRYPTAGAYGDEEAQPFYVNSPYGIVLVHNGNLTNAKALKDELWRSDLRHLNTHSDTEVLLNVFAHELQRLHKPRLETQDIFQAVRAVHQRCMGAYAVAALIPGHGLVAFRDPNGIRPLILGERTTTLGKDYMVASESVALSTLGFKIVRDVKPGEAIYITEQGDMFCELCTDKPSYCPCLFEYVYLARPDSVIDKISVYKVRLNLGESLADKILAQHPLLLDADVVIPIPDTSRPVALQLALRLGKKYREGFVKNRYVGRTFIMPGQTQRRLSVKRKLNALESEFHNKNVLLIDDSIVRGTTCKEIIQMARQAGANKVYFASAAPEVRYPNVYGIDMPTHAELIAHGREVAEICQDIGADALIYQDINALVKACQLGNPAITRFEDSVFTGNYLTGDIDESYLQALAQLRKQQQARSSQSEP